jgi:hypothetical protein
MTLPSENPGGYGPPPAYGQPPAPYGAPRTETKAWVALGLAVAAYTPTIPFLGAIAALLVASSARRDILASGGALTGLDLCRWAVWLSVVHLVFVVLLVVLVLLAFLGVLLLPFGIGA